MTFEQAPDFCRVCGKNTCDCVYCHGARYVRTAASPDLIRCDACNPAPERDEPAQPPPTPIRARRGSTYADRLNS